MKTLLTIAAIFCLFSCSSTEKTMQRTGFRNYPKKEGKGYHRATQMYSGYGTYKPPRRKGVDL